MTTKQPFEKVVSLIERKKLLTRILDEHQDISIKGDTDDNLYQFKSLKQDRNGDLLGRIFLESQETRNLDFKAAVGNFAFGHERFFFKTDFIKDSKDHGDFRLIVPQELYVLQRRQSFRIVLTDKAEVRFEVSTVSDCPYQGSLRVIDVSQGGLRLQLPKEFPPIVAGEFITGTLYPPSGKNLFVTISVKHFLQSADGEYASVGCEYKNLDQLTNTRAQAMVFDLQRLVVFGK